MIVVTGGTGGLGVAVVERLLADGRQVAVPWIDEREIERFRFADRVRLDRVDLGDQAAVEQYIDAVTADDGLEASIHLAGGFAMAPIEQTSAEDVLRLFRLNTLTTFLCCRAAVVAMRRHGRGGRIVNVAARPALQPVGGMLAYSMSKAAVVSLTASLAEEVREDRILVNAVAPSIMDTPANRAAMPDADHGRWPAVSAVAETIAFLAGPGNTLTSGAVVPVYGRA